MRSSGILLPISSLPGKYGIGCFSREAYEFVDMLEKSRQKYWQILPIGPTSYGDSPYQSFSTFAGNPYFISLEDLIEKGFITTEECEMEDFGDNQEYIDYEKMYNSRFKVLKKAYERSDIDSNQEFRHFREENQYWLKDYAMFMAIKERYDGASFELWDEDIRTRQPEALNEYENQLSKEIGFYEFIQFEFYQQWYKLKNYANNKGIKIIGDIPIYVAYDSSDVWSHHELFQMDDEGKALAVAGCPPDGFSPTGQLWGNPLYKWEYHRETGYDWWIKRIEKSMKLYDVIRIDHFRGFDEYYSIPAGSENAVNGRWEKGPGLELFDAIKNKLGKINVIAEDLGYITDSVRKLVKDTEFPNMKVLQFAFYAGDRSEYLPYRYEKNCVVYTGTHDNETTLGWLRNLRYEDISYINAYIGKCLEPGVGLVYEIIRMAQASVADMCIIPLQDYLCLGNEARTNFPSTLGDNWKWRVTKDKINDSLVDKIREITVLYGRD